MAGRNINYFLMDGTPSGRIKCTIANWTGVAYRIPRTELEKCKEREDLKQSGVYFLFGTEEDTGDSVVYIGQAGNRQNGEGILHRLHEHRRSESKSYWTEAVVFTTSNNSFGPTEISWLENNFYSATQNANRYAIDNRNSPSGSNVPEEKESELLEFVDYAKIVMGVLGYKIFEPLAKPATAGDADALRENADAMLYLQRKSKKSGKVIEATCLRTSEGFVVKKGSMIETIDSDSIPPGVKRSRQAAKIDDNGILQEDVLCASPSYASAFVIGGHTNGLTDWKEASGRTLKDIESDEDSETGAQ